MEGLEALDLPACLGLPGFGQFDCISLYHQIDVWTWRTSKQDVSRNTPYKRQSDSVSLCQLTQFTELLPATIKGVFALFRKVLGKRQLLCSLNSPALWEAQ